MTTRRDLVSQLYPSEARAVLREVEALLDRHGRRRPSGAAPWDEGDAWLITYADQFQQPGEPPLRTLRAFLADHLDWLNGVHVLPFYPWSSDDGFSVTDYLGVDPRYGTWSDVAALGAERRLMVDAVINHMSVGGEWFRRFLAGDPEYAGFFRIADPDTDLSATVRPRTTPLLTNFAGRWVWTTFSADQADLDYRNPRTLLAVLDVLLTYAARGAAVIRLDAIAFLWKEEGTSSLHLPQTHAVIRLLRACLDECYPDVLLITETNVPHDENVSYFGPQDVREAQVVYQFALAPLVLHALDTGDATPLAEWIDALEPPGPGRTFLNFLASHDGVGVRPAEGLLPAEAVAALVELTHRAGGAIGSRTLPDGREVPYELNSTWFDLMAAGYDEDDAIARHLAAHTIMLALPGIPAFYVHSIFGSSNDEDGYAASGIPRRLNRRRFTDVPALACRLADPTSREARVAAGLRRLVAQRRTSPAFHPEAPVRVLGAGSGTLTIERDSVRIGVDLAPPFQVRWPAGKAGSSL